MPIHIFITSLAKENRYEEMGDDGNDGDKQPVAVCAGWR